MLIKSVLLPLFFFYNVEALIVRLPDHWPLCKPGPEMNECLKKAVQIAVKDLIKGNETLGVYAIDPWKVKSFTFNQFNGPVAVSLGAKNITVRGYRGTRILNVTNDWKYMDIILATPKVNVIGNYFMNGTLLTFPIHGKGKFLLKMEGFVGQIQLIYDRIVKRDKEYFKVRDSQMFVDMQDAHVRFDNLFDGNKILGDRMNDLINGNWQLILDAVRSVVARAVADPLKQLAAGLFTKVPVDFIVPK